MARHFLAAFLAALLLVVPALAFADDWTAIRLRGTVEQLVDGTWKPLILGAVVPDDRPIRTGPDGRVDFRRDQDQITLGGDTQIQIKDQTGQRFTTIVQDHGLVESDVDVQNVQHFSVETPYLAAVVKGTHFVVDSSTHGSSVVVTRGIVAVESRITREQTTVTVGQTASIEVGAQLTVTGSGKLPPVLSLDSSAPVAAPAGQTSTTTTTADATIPAAGAPGAAADGKVKLIPTAQKDPGLWPFNLKSNEYGPVVVLGGVLIGLLAGGILLVFRRFFG